MKLIEGVDYMDFHTHFRIKYGGNTWAHFKHAIATSKNRNEVTILRNTLAMALGGSFVNHQHRILTTNDYIITKMREFYNITVDNNSEFKLFCRRLGINPYKTREKLLEFNKANGVKFTWH